jgi:2-amino-4-hydroxy-6-hydroxymethyldihydropteridine diphosphokinase
MQSKQVVLIIGGNLYDRMALIDQCRNSLADFLGPATKTSDVYESEAWGGKSSGNYLNQVLVFDTDLSAREILDQIQAIENTMGRNRTEKWGDRTMDIDIIFFGDEVIETDQLTIPHSYMHLRRFVLVPLAEILPELIHPTLGKSVAELLEACPDDSKVWKLA